MAGVAAARAVVVVVEYWGVEVKSKARTYPGVGNMRSGVSDWLQQHSGGLSSRPQTPSASLL